MDRVNRKRLLDESAPEANGHGVGSRARMQLRKQVADVRLDRLLRQEELPADLAIREAVGDELQHLELPRGRRGLHRQVGDAVQRDHLGGRRRRRGRYRRRRPAASCRLLEPAGVTLVPVENLIALCCVHEGDIGRAYAPLEPQLAATGHPNEYFGAAGALRLPAGRPSGRSRRA